MCSFDWAFLFHSIQVLKSFSVMAGSCSVPDLRIEMGVGYSPIMGISLIFFGFLFVFRTAFLSSSEPVIGVQVFVFWLGLVYYFK